MIEATLTGEKTHDGLEVVLVVLNGTGIAWALWDGEKLSEHSLTAGAVHDVEEQIR